MDQPHVELYVLSVFIVIREMSHDLIDSRAINIMITAFIKKTIAQLIYDILLAPRIAYEVLLKALLGIVSTRHINVLFRTTQHFVQQEQIYFLLESSSQNSPWTTAAAAASINVLFRTI